MTQSNTSEAAPIKRLLLAIPEGLNHHAVRARKAAVLAASGAGLPELVAEQIALDAELQQQWHDNPTSRAIGQFQCKTEAEELAATILTAQAYDRSQLLPVDDDRTTAADAEDHSAINPA